MGDGNEALGDFLRSRRDAADPARLALPSYGRRRVSGIRREELAVLAGVSTSYYVRIEQGVVTASPGVLEAIAAALRLDEEDRRHLVRLAQTRDYGPADPPGEGLPEGVERLLRTYDDVPIGVLGRDMALLGWNRLGHQVFAGHLPFDAPSSTPGGFSWARMLFLDERARSLFVDWEEVTIDIVGRLRASHARDPADVAIALLIDELGTASERFATLWRWHPVRQRPLGEVHLDHPVVGDLRLRDLILRPADADEQMVILFQPADPDTEARLRTLRLEPSAR
jgi:transcriptional regulator with XRE-family HTH domain